MSSISTQGPWLYRAKSDSVHLPADGSAHQFGEQVFRFHDEQGPSEEVLALILATPALLRALDDVTKRLMRYANTESDAEAIRKALEALDQAKSA